VLDLAPGDMYNVAPNFPLSLHGYLEHGSVIRAVDNRHHAPFNGLNMSLIRCDALICSRKFHNRVQYRYHLPAVSGQSGIIPAEGGRKRAHGF
jgi:hypothetical protein